MARCYQSTCRAHLKENEQKHKRTRKLIKVVNFVDILCYVKLHHIQNKSDDEKKTIQLVS